MRSLFLIRHRWQALAFAGICLFPLVFGTPTAQAGGKALTVIVVAEPPYLTDICVGGTFPFWVQVYRSGELVFAPQVTLTSANELAPQQIVVHAGIDGQYRLPYQPTRAGNDTITIKASFKGATSQPKVFKAKVVHCREKVSLFSSGTYQAPSTDGTATANVLDMMDPTTIQLGSDGKYTGTGDVFFSEQMSFYDKSCGTVSTTQATATVKVDIQGTTDDTGEILTLNTVFHPFSAGWTVSGCGVSNTTQNPNMGDMNGYLNLNKFDLASDGGSFSDHLSFPGWSGVGTATVIVYPEEDQGNTSMLAPSQPYSLAGVTEWTKGVGK